MTFTLKPDRINFSFELSSTYYYLQNVIERNFTNKIGRKTKIIIFPIEEEEVQRKYLLKLIAKIFKKQNSHASQKQINAIQNATQHTIKLTLELKNQILPDLKIGIDLKDKQVICMSMQNNNRLFVNYIKNYFKGDLIQYRARIFKLNIFPSSEYSITRLQNLFTKREHMAWYVSFDYNEEEFEDFSDYWFKKSPFKRRYKALGGILEEYFQTLGCTQYDTYVKVRQRYLKLVKMYHPDRHIGEENTQIALYYREKFDKVQTAYEILKTYYNEEKST